MEIRNHSTSAHQRFEEANTNLVRQNRARLQGARDQLASYRREVFEQQRLARTQMRPGEESEEGARPAGGDSIEISADARTLADGTARGAEADDARARLLSSLRESHDRGELATPERLRASAARLLLGEV